MNEVCQVKEDRKKKFPWVSEEDEGKKDLKQKKKEKLELKKLYVVRFWIPYLYDSLWQIGNFAC